VLKLRLYFDVLITKLGSLTPITTSDSVYYVISMATGFVMWTYDYKLCVSELVSQSHDYFNSLID